MSRRDRYYNRAKQAGYRARSAFKLKQLDERLDVLEPGDTVVDLGAAPGSWVQVAAEAVGPSGHIIAVDRQRIDPFDNLECKITTIRGDITDEATHQAIKDAATGGVDVVLSDLAPNMTGEYDLDQARSVHLANQAITVAKAVLDPGGSVLVKVFEGRDFESFLASIEETFASVQTTVPDASRDASSEVYVHGRGYLTAPVAVGDELEVTIEAIGEEGDGIAHVEGYTIFVPETSPDETVTIVVEDCKPRFGFARRV